MPPITERNAVRAILLTKADEVLLLRIHPPGEDNYFWITPGGGLEAGESDENGLRRELKEELGLDRFEIGPVVWRRQHTFNWGDKRICQRERYHVVHVDRFTPRISDAIEAQLLMEFRWWPIASLAQSTERVTPRSLADIIARYLASGPPAELPDVEVGVD